MRIGGGVVGIGEVGPQITDLQREIDRIKGVTLGQSFVQVDQPDVDSSFAPIYTWEKNGYAVTLQYFVPGFTQSLIIHLVKRADVVDAATYGQVVKEKIKDITDTDRAAQLVAARFDSPHLDSNSQYDIVDIIARDPDGNGHQNPEGGPDYSGYPGNVLFTFTTPFAPGVVQAGGPNLINGGGMMNSADQYTVLRGGASVPADQDKLGAVWQTNVNSGVWIDRLAGGTLVSDGIQWLDTHAILKHTWNIFTLGGRPSTRIQKRIIPGETYTFSCLTACEDALQEKQLFVGLYEQGTGSVIVQATPTNWLFSIIPTWKVFVAILRVPTSYVPAHRHWVQFGITGDLSGSNSWFSTKWKLERGENVSPWMPHQEEDLLDSQANITSSNGHGSFGQTTGGIYDASGQVFGGPSGILIGEFIRNA